MVNGAQVNGVPMVNGNGVVPQGLYRNQNIATGQQIQPQTLFYNLGSHPMNPVTGVPIQPALPQHINSQAIRPSIASTQVVNTMNSTATLPNVTAPANKDQKHNIDAAQIRIGTCKFIPDTSVTFKNEGVLFSLKDYSRAPVLLNARAIVKCKVNFEQPFPAYFFHLESSCIRQLQAIFNLSPQTFTDTGKTEHQRYITIFPAKVNPRDRIGVSAVFNNMKEKYKWSNNKLQEITSLQVLDIIWPPELPKPTQQAQPARPTISQAPPASIATALQQPALNVRQPVRPLHAHNLSRGLPVAPPLVSNTVSQQRGPARILQNATKNFDPITNNKLYMPDNEGQWLKIKESLSKGGLYHVVALDKTESYCLWDGENLRPCISEDREVVLEATHARIGSLKAYTVGQVRVSNVAKDNGVTFKIKLSGPGQIADLHFPLQTLQNCRVCFHPRLLAMFLSPSPSYAQFLRSKCRMSKSDPTYNPSSPLERQKHIIVFFKSINKDQQEVLRKLRFAANPIVVEIPLLQAMTILSDIKQDSKVQKRISDYMNGGNKQNMEETLVLLKNYVRDVDSPTTRTTNENEDNDDDDDEVIMTEEEVGIKCPYTQQVMKYPIRNKHCGHNYEKDAILDFIRRRMNKPSAHTNPAKCPYAGCANTIPLVPADLEDNSELKDHIESVTKKRTAP